VCEIVQSHFNFSLLFQGSFLNVLPYKKRQSLVPKRNYNYEFIVQAFIRMEEDKDYERMIEISQLNNLSTHAHFCGG